MRIKGAVYVANAGPIPVYAHWSALVLVVLAFLWTPDLQGGIAALIVLSLAIVLHELGHAITAHVFRVPNIVIMLWGMGGVMLSKRSGPERPGRDLVITAAGPAVNYALAGLAFLGMTLLRDTAPDQVIDGQGQQTMWALLLKYGFWINLVLALFNSLPLFPLDGGHITYHLLRLARLPLATTRKACMVLAVVCGLGVIAFDAWWHGGRPSLFNLFIVVFLVSQSIQLLKAPVP